MHPDRPHYDVVVVGARAAGAATAMLLARAGLRVLVVDRSRYGADTLSTHALMRGGVLQLHRWGLLDRLVDAGTPAVRRTTFRYDDEEVVIPISDRRTASTPSTRRGGRCSTRCSSTRQPKPAPRSATASPSSACAPIAGAGSRASTAATTPAGGWPSTRALVVGADGLRSTVAATSAPRC